MSKNEKIFGATHAPKVCVFRVVDYDQVLLQKAH